MLHGRNDQPCPPEQTTLVLSRKLPRADVHLLGRCGHNLPRERSATFIEIASAFFGTG
jgi:pimeloyl-ACP methyl ester carboxylesterase